MIENETQYHATKQYIHKLETYLLEARKRETPSNYQAMSKGYLHEIDKKQAEIRAYLSHAEPLKAAA